MVGQGAHRVSVMLSAELVRFIWRIDKKWPVAW
jgi:hypothetical protein